MNELEHTFRGSAFGFHRQDVVDYIEQADRAHDAQLADVMEQLKREQAARMELEQALALSKQEAQANCRDTARTQESLTGIATQLEEARSQIEELKLRLQVTEKSMADLQLAAERMAPAAKAYEAIKEKAAGIELEAHNRAQIIIREGEKTAARTRSEVALWLSKVESGYQRLRADVAATLAHANGELERTSRSLDGVTQELADHGKQLVVLAKPFETKLPK